MRDQVVAEKPCLLRVALNRHSSNPSESLDVAVDALVTADGFDIHPMPFQTLTLAGSQDADPVLFKLTPHVAGPKKVKVEFFQGSRYVGGVAVKTEVVNDEIDSTATPAGILGVAVIDREAAAPDLTMLVTETERGDHSRGYGFTLHSPANGLAFYRLEQEMRLYGSPTTFLDGAYGELGSLGLRTHPDRLAKVLDDLGEDLYEKLFPRELRNLWEDRIGGDVETIQIVSDETWLPWELVKPTGEDFLCATYLLSQWVSGPPVPSVFATSKGVLIDGESTEWPLDHENAVKMIRPKRGGFLGLSRDIPSGLDARIPASFLKAIEEGRPLAEALRTARAELRRFPTAAWLAYRLFGDPLGKVRLQPDTPAGG